MVRSTRCKSSKICRSRKHKSRRKSSKMGKSRRKSMRKSRRKSSKMGKSRRKSMRKSPKRKYRSKRYNKFNKSSNTLKKISVTEFNEILAAKIADYLGGNIKDLTEVDPKRLQMFEQLAKEDIFREHTLNLSTEEKQKIAADKKILDEQYRQQRLYAAELARINLEHLLTYDLSPSHRENQQRVQEKRRQDSERESEEQRRRDELDCKRELARFSQTPPQTPQPSSVDQSLSPPFVYRQPVEVEPPPLLTASRQSGRGDSCWHEDEDKLEPQRDPSSSRF